MSNTGSSSVSRPATTGSQVSGKSPPVASGSPSSVSTAIPPPSGGDVSLEEGISVDLLTRGGTIYTGPDGQRPHRMKVAHPDYQFVGEGDRSMENTSGVAYLFRGAKDTPFPRAKGGHIGEIGWSAKRSRAACT